MHIPDPDVPDGATSSTGWWAVHRDLVALGLTVATLAGWNISRSTLVPQHVGIPASLGMALLLGGLGVLGGLGWRTIGLARATMARGLAYGGAVFALVVAVITLVALISATRGALHDSRVHVPLATMLFRVLVAIPLGTVVLEELAFRGTLLGLLRRRLPVWWAVATIAVLFGLWHVKDVFHNASGGIAVGTVLSTFAFTTVAGVGFGWLRVRSDSLLAPVLAHIATNSVTFAAAWVVWH